MASIFLSYAREDAAKAKALAKSLERAGHSVWWDRNLHGGAEFSGEIEAALNDAEVVLVLWSDAAIHSAWVRDEAAEGRDSGRLVPLLLDSNPPPLGFRQLHAISIAGWSGRGNPPDFAAIKAAIAKLGAAQASPEPRGPTPRRRMALAAIASLAALLLAAAVGFFVLRGGPAKAETPVIAVLPFADLSPQRDKAFLAEGVAEAILSGLAKEDGIKVLGSSSARQLHEAGSAAPEMRKAMGITHILEGSARSLGDQLRMSVRLVDASSGSQIWAEEYHRRLDNIFAIQDEIGRAVAERLRGSFASQRPAGQRPNADTYTLYLAARAKMRDREISSLKEAMGLTKQMLSADPSYAPGHALYAELLELMSYDNYGTLSPERVKQLALPHARKAIQLAPDSPEGYAALGMILDGGEAIAPLQKAIQLDPARGELRLWLASAYNLLGRNEDALREVEAAAAMEPLWPTIIMTRAYTLAASGRMAEAEEVIRQFERRGGSPARAAKIRGDIAGWSRGDYSEGIRLIRLALQKDPLSPLADISLAWQYSTLGLDDRAAASAKALPGYTRLYVIGEYAAVAEQGRRDGAAIWRQPDADVVIDALAIERDWATIAKLHDHNRKSLHAVCADNRPWLLQMGINLTIALAEQGRRAEARRFLDCVKSNLAKTGKGPIRTPYLSNSGVDLVMAQVHAIEGRPREAFLLLDRAIDRGARSRHGSGLANFPAFHGLRSAPQYAQLDSRLRRLIARERAEALADLRGNA